jgi:hypothetical protein
MIGDPVSQHIINVIRQQEIKSRLVFSFALDQQEIRGLRAHDIICDDYQQESDEVHQIIKDLWVSGDTKPKEISR